MVALPSFRIGEPVTSEKLSVFPLFLDSPKPVRYRLADDALADSTVVVEEVSDGGSVPQLAVENRNDTLVLFLEGQELRGAKQNRVLNTSVLIAAQTKTVLPVSCVEEGRWRTISKKFIGSDYYASFKLRALLKASVTRSAVAGEGHKSDQGAVWDEVHRQMKALRVKSATQAMADTYEAHKPHLDKVRTEVPYVAGAAGLALVVGGKVVSLDLFDTPETCQKIWPRLVGGVALDILEETETKPITVAEVQAALDGLRAMKWQPVPPAGAGEEHRAVEPSQWQASVLTLTGELIHGSLVAV
jgi:hypothetical protein